MTDPTTLDLSTLRCELPAEAFSSVAPTGADGYAVDGVAALGAVFPATVEEVAAVLRWANARGVAVWPRGGGSKLATGNVPARPGLVLGLERLDRLVDHVPGDLTATMQAGLRLKRLQEMLRPSRQWLPIDPPFVEEATIGGIMAAASVGSRRYGHGGMRDLVLGTTIVLPDGTVARAGGRVVKNVTGYDLMKLYIGSFGTLGVLVECTCKLQPLPLKESVLLLMARELDGACEALRRIRGSCLVPTALDLLNQPALSLLAERANLEPAGETCALLIGLEGTQSELQRSLDEITRRHAGGLSSEWIVLDGLDTTMIWNIIQDFPKVLASFDRPFFLAAASLPVSGLAGFLQAVQDDLRAGGFTPYIYAQAGNGEARLAAFYEAERLEEAAASVRRARQRAVAQGGCLILERAEPAFKQHCETWGEVGGALPIMRALKQQYDPNGVMNPGRFAGGI
ncbi:MAG: FAD-binding oxidoreductase [Candidatus Tectomicrobia bacterium]|nr:FAD-binding oxidoreductase [Candidatus Tectomicrobia bacterium]